MTETHPTINCPHCGESIDVSEVLYHEVEHRLKGEFEARRKEERKRLRVEARALEARAEELAQQEEEQEDLVEKAVRDRLKERERKLEKKIESKVRDEQSGLVEELKDELKAKSEQVKEFNKAQAKIERLEREKEEAESKAEAAMERELGKRLKKESRKIQERLEEDSSLKQAEQAQVIEQLREQIGEMKRKAEQGSMQLQGEAQELVIEEWLAAEYPLNEIEEIKKGARGGDCIQTVNTRSAPNCGRIYYESKRTKHFQPQWIEKFKDDIRARGANIGVLVTEAMPVDLPRMGLKQGVWICSFAEFKGLSAVLRQWLIKMHEAVAHQEFRGDKMSMVYDYMTSDEFRLQVEAIVEGFTQMKEDLEAEKRAMTGIWKKREKQIEKVLLNTNHMYSSIKGIAGKAVQGVSLLELGEGDVEDDEE